MAVILTTTKLFNGRYVGGASAGGYAVLHYAFRHQDMFSKVGGYMPAIELELAEEDRSYFKDMDVWDKYDPICIARNNRISNDLCVYLDAGDHNAGQRKRCKKNPRLIESSDCCRQEFQVNFNNLSI